MWLNKWIVVAGILALSGCQSSSAPSQQATPPPLQVAQPGGGTVTADQAVDTDVSAQRLDDILGAMLLYYRANSGMPPALEDLRTVAGFGENLNLIAPSGQPYAYVPQGLSIAGVNKRLVVYDPAETPKGRRWCILVSTLNPGAPLTAEVLDIPEAEFRAFLLSMPQ